jgi:HPt (histidine-containing phosphotransfer) domain-containing protein
VPGFSLAQGLSHLGGKMQVLVRVLRTFLGSYRTGVPGLLLAADRADAAAVMTACHALRGACASIGAAGVADLAAALESTASTLDAQMLAESAQRIHQEIATLVERLADELGA